MKCRMSPRWVLELARAHNVPFSGHYWVPTSFPQTFPPIPTAGRLVQITTEPVGGGRLQAEVWAEVAGGGLVVSVWNQRRRKWSGWQQP